MRITADAKAETRRRILQVATELFTRDGWQSTTTRSIARAAGIAAGTLFNYFPTKEAVAAELIREALCEGDSEIAGDELSAEAALFTLIWSGLRRLREFRPFLADASDTIFSPLARSSPGSAGEAIRVEHLQRVEFVLNSHGFSALSAVFLQLYWTLYLGVFAFWARDESPGQEDTLALLDQSLTLFVGALRIDREKRSL